MLITVAVFAPLFFFVPIRGSKSNIETTMPEDHSTDLRGTGVVSVPLIWICLAGCLLFFCGQTTVWAFAERIGANSGFEATAVGTLLSVTLMFAVAGSRTLRICQGDVCGGGFFFATGKNRRYCGPCGKAARLRRNSRLTYYRKPAESRTRISRRSRKQQTSKRSEG